MALLHIFTAGARVLKQKASQVPEITEEIKILVDNMAETMRAAGGVGLAAPQVGTSLRIFIIDFGYLDFLKAEEENEASGKGARPKLEFRPVAFINPEIIKKSGSLLEEEGCLSVPTYQAKVPRAAKVACRFTDINGKTRTVETEGFGAIAIQHESDHLEGIVFIDKITPLKRGIALKKVKKYLANIKENGNETEKILYGN